MHKLSLLNSQHETKPVMNTGVYNVIFFNSFGERSIRINLNDWLSNYKFISEPRSNTREWWMFNLKQYYSTTH